LFIYLFRSALFLANICEPTVSLTKHGWLSISCSYELLTYSIT